MKRLVTPVIPAILLLCAAPAAAQGWRATVPPAPAGPALAAGIHSAVAIGLSADEVTWHVRAGLNVAALACRDSADFGTADAYNQLLTAESRPLAAADAGVKAQYRSRYGASWEAIHDRDMTRLYNHFAQPTAHDGLCAAARNILSQSEGLSPIEFADFAAWALPLLDAPFAGGDVLPTQVAEAVIPAPPASAFP